MFEEYRKLGEPEKAEKAVLWQVATGLQKVDQLEPSAYLIENAKENIEGKITFPEVKENLDIYYQTQKRLTDFKRTEEADKVSARIAEILAEKTFSFKVPHYIALHQRLFENILSPEIAGKIRTYNIEKKERILGGESVFYAGADEIQATLAYDFEQERNVDYRKMSKKEQCRQYAKFTSDIWQIHAFGEGNTRTTAVFMIKYLRSVGFETDNLLFSEHALYFRNALVRANYTNMKKEIYVTDLYLNYFFENLLLGAKLLLQEDALHIGKNCF